MSEAQVSVVSSQIFEQALKSGDESLLEFVIRKTPVAGIPDLIANMATQLLASFPRSFTNYITKYPEQLGLALPWLECFVDQKKGDIASSPECQKRVRDLEHILRQRTEQMGQFVEASALTQFVAHEREGKGIGLPINEDDVQILSENPKSIESSL